MMFLQIQNQFPFTLRSNLMVCNYQKLVRLSVLLSCDYTKQIYILVSFEHILNTVLFFFNALLKNLVC